MRYEANRQQAGRPERQAGSLHNENESPCTLICHALHTHLPRPAHTFAPATPSKKVISSVMTPTPPQPPDNTTQNNASAAKQATSAAADK